MKKLSLVLMMSLMSLNSFASPDINAKGCMNTILIDVRGDDRGFLYCADKSDSTTCRRLGEKQWYSIDALNSQRHDEQAKMVGNAILTLAFGVATAASTTIDFIPPAVVGTAMSAAGTITYAVKTHNRYKDAELISEDVINDKDVIVDSTCSELNAAAVELEEILNRT